MLSVLPIIPSRISQSFYRLLLIYSYAIAYYIIPTLFFNFCFVSDNNVHNSYHSWISQNFYPLFLIYSHAITYYSYTTL